jgi:hypothetical protein
MKIESDSLREELRALRLAPCLVLPEYSADPIAQSRLGRFFAKITTPVDARAMPVRRCR